MADDKKSSAINKKGLLSSVMLGFADYSIKIARLVIFRSPTVAFTKYIPDGIVSSGVQI